MALPTLKDFDFNGKKVLARFDFNVPLDKDQKILDTTRIDMALETINHILNQGASKLVLMSHLGRPKGKAEPKYSLEPVAEYLAQKLNEEVVLTESCLDRGIRTLLELPNPKVILLQNLRFHPEETQGDTQFAKALSQYGEYFVFDAFGAAHRKHASTYEINRFYPRRACVGFLVEKEIHALNKVLQPKTPFCAIVGGAKVSDKINIVEKLIPMVDHLLIGGAMAYSFLKAKGYSIGKSLCSEEDVKLAKKILHSGSSQKIVLPIDHLVADAIDGQASVCDQENIAEDKMGLDIGPQTIELFKTKLASSKTVLWNGPMGLFEKEAFSKGTFAIANTLAELKDCYSLVGGGDSVSAVNKSGLSQSMGHVSTGGGASLEYIEQGSLPGIQAIRFGLS